MATEVIFSFDTEDFTTQRNADAILGLANLFTEEGVTAHFAVVGLLAQQLLDWGRQDVIDAMKPHVLGFHSYGHSLHPTMSEMCDRPDHDAAVKELEASEAKGLELLRKAFGDKPILYAVPPGNDVTSTALYFYRKNGIPFYFGGYINDDENTLLDFSGITHVPYTVSMEGIYLAEKPFDVDELLEKFSHLKRVIFYHHPNMSVKKEFWDLLNYYRRNRREFNDWVEAPDRTLGETITFWSKFRMFLRRLKADPRFKLIDANELLAERDAHLPKPITPEALPALAEELAAMPEGVAPLKSAPYSVSDLFNAAAAFLQGKKEYVPGLGKGFLEEPATIPAPVTLSAEAIRKAAQAIVLEDYIPTEFDVDGVCLGPAEMLFAMVEALKGTAATIAVSPRSPKVDISSLKELTTFTVHNHWVFAESLEDKWVSKRLRLQAWTWRNYGF